MWGFPYLTRFAVRRDAGPLSAAMAWIPDQRAPLVFGVASVLIMLAAFGLRRAAAPRAVAQRTAAP